MGKGIDIKGPWGREDCTKGREGKGRLGEGKKGQEGKIVQMKGSYRLY